jgi:uncharacterized membrane protein YidH (DUF202 family)
VTVADPLYDPGLQPERTLLAWRRTCLALALGVAVATRLSLELVGVAALLLGLLGLVLCGAAWVAAGRRYQRARRALSHDGALPTAGGSIAAVALVAVLIAAAGAAGTVVLAGMPR